MLLQSIIHHSLHFDMRVIEEHVESCPRSWRNTYTIKRLICQQSRHEPAPPHCNDWDLQQQAPALLPLPCACSAMCFFSSSEGFHENSLQTFAHTDESHYVYTAFSVPRDQEVLSKTHCPKQEQRISLIAPSYQRLQSLYLCY